MTLPKVLVCGAGHMGMNHVRVLRSLSDRCTIAGIVEPDAERRAKLPDLPTYGTLDAALATGLPDGAVVVSPTITHFGVAVPLLERGIPLLVEKPVTATLEDGERLLERIAATGTPCVVGHVERFNPAVVAVRALIADGQLGEVVNFSARRVGGTPEDVEKAGDVLVDLAVHDIDIARWLLGEVELRGAIGHRGRKVDSATMLFSSGETTVDLHVNWVTPVKLRQLTVTGTDGHVEVNLITQTATLTRKNPVLTARGRRGNHFFDEYLLSFAVPDQIQIGILKREPLREQLGAFVGALSRRTFAEAGLVSAADGVRALALAESARRRLESEAAR